jgi:hypothetical protein
MEIRVQQITGIVSGQRPNSSEVTLTCSMTQDQMYGALLEFLGHISNETWRTWANEIEESI